MQVIRSILINAVVTVLEQSLIVCSHTMFHHQIVFKSASSCLTKIVQIPPHVGED